MIRRHRRAAGLTEPELQLNAALQAARYAVARGEILPTDMPNLTAAGDGVTPRPRTRQRMRSSAARQYPSSCSRVEAGIPVRVVESDSLLFDVDLPEDYRLVFDSRGS